MVGAKGVTLVQLALCCFLIVVKGYHHTCDFNEDISLLFGDSQTKSDEKTCILTPDVLHKVTIKCGSKDLKYNLNPPNCFEEVYDTSTMNNRKKITEYIDGVSTIMKRHNDEEDMSDVSFRVPPNIIPKQEIYCICEHNDIIKVKRNGEHIYTKEISNKGIVKIVLPTVINKIDGCDFTKNNSNVFTKGYDIDFFKNVENIDDVICKVQAQENKLIGFKCPLDFIVEPEECFINGYNLNGKIQNIQNVITLSELIIDHYNNVFYSRVPERIHENFYFFCVCSKNDKRLIAHFDFKVPPPEKPVDVQNVNVLQGSESPLIGISFFIVIALLTSSVFFTIL
ncbi:6-cysteine protein, putative [Plasmodium ovale]|uniref:6-cysteine protein (P12) n=3 Tax=Plasmodium ovale TaxID=36330 RepID=A0A1A8WQ40_PLAOA|nr:6-cysteine protein (P12) [Plasmodium ovale curtisi]SBS95004.1 6-cysteine protein (P12) [Plasmodium ovale curtisi]SCP05137.1 6-cysteine protein, putative [Plasmodium ovale]